MATIVALFMTWGFDDRGDLFSSQARAKTDRSGTYDLAKGRVLTKVIGHVRTHYVDRSRIDLGTMAVRATQAIQRSIPEVMVKVEFDKTKKPRALQVNVGELSRVFSLEKVSDLYELNWKLMDIYDFLARHLPPASDFEGVEYGSVNGVLATLDPHSVVLSPRMFREMQVGTKGKFGGLGIVISIRDGLLTVMSVMSSTPAERAGLESGDKIVQIGEESTVNMPLNDAVSRLRGKPGTSVTIWVRREGDAELKRFKIVREEIRIRSIEHKKISKGIGYISIRNFQANTSTDLRSALEELRKKDALDGLILDLRENPGGLLDQAIEVSDQFLAHGNIVTTVKEGAQNREERHATEAGTFSDVPMVVLINRGSASASEIVAGALKHNNRATVMGSLSYGKGSVQVLYRLDDAALKLTVAQYLTPGDISIQSVGIVPDVEILPIRVSKEGLDLHSAAESERGESNLKGHLTSSRTRRTKSSLQLKMLLKAKGKGKKGADKVDSLTNLARDFLLAARSPKRKKALVQAASTLSKRAHKEDKAIAQALGKLGIDWDEGPAISAPKAKVELSFESDASPIVAGSKMKVVGKVTNLGKRPLYRIHGVLSSSMEALDGVEMVFGKVAPGETRVWRAPVKFPHSQHTAADSVRLALFSNDKPLSLSAQATLEVRGHALPLFGYAAQVLDPQDGGGNGNGMVQRGEAITLAIRIFNQGKGEAKEVLVTIKNESGEHVFIDKGRATLGAIEAGKSKLARFKLRVKAPLRERQIQLKLSIVDQELRTWAHDELSLPVFPAQFEGRKSKQGWVRIHPGGSLLRGGAHRDTARLSQLPGGAELRVIGETADFLEVRSHKGREPLQAIGWIPRSKATWLKSAPDQAASWEPEPQYEAPAIELQELDSVASLTQKASISLRGRVRFDDDSPRKARSFYIFRGEDKVFFKSASAGSNTLDFESRIELEKGSNELVLIARESNTHVSRRYLTVYRR